MQANQLDVTSKRVLRALYELAQANCSVDSAVLSQVMALRTGDVARVLRALEAHGLVRADLTRLTMIGLAVAVRLPAMALAAPRPRIAVAVRSPLLRGLASASPFAPLARCAGASGQR